jgi:hypothetical protein
MRTGVDAEFPQARQSRQPVIYQSLIALPAQRFGIGGDLLANSKSLASFCA